MIPRIIHQTWKTDDVPEQWRACATSVREQHPGWEYRLWTDAANRDFVAEHYPRLLQTYDAYPYAIQRADAVRYCLLHHYGGVYVDLDVECLQPFDALIEGQECLIVPEPPQQAAWLGLGSLPSNAFMAARPRHPFFEAIIASLIADRSPMLTHRDVLETTGPAMLRRVLQAYGGGDLTLLPSHTAFPYVVDSLELRALQSDPDDALRDQLRSRGVFAVHYWANSWVGSLSGELINPEPHAVPGYDFYPGMDSLGHDIANVGRHILQAASRCDAIPGAVAFNTDGFVKDRLLPRRHWVAMKEPHGGKAGLYVKRRKGSVVAVVRKLRDAVTGRWGATWRRV